MGALGPTWKPARDRRSWARLWSGVAACSLVATTLVLLPASPAQAATTKSLQLHLTSARTEPRAFGGAGVNAGDPIPNFTFILNIDDTGTTDQRTATGGCSASGPNYPQSCLWPSIKEPSGWSPIYTQGNQLNLPSNLPDGRYLVSVLADGYTIDGAHFCVDMDPPSVPGCASPLSGPLDIQLQPNPLPDGTLRAQVFADTAATNMGFDTGEDGLPGFSGHIFDTLGEVQTDVYGNPLCTKYRGENPKSFEIPLGSLDADMLPVPITGSGGKCLSDSTGMLAVPHLGPNRYTIMVNPPDNGQTWIQTTTLEGNHDYDMWLMPGDTGYSTILAHGGEPTPDPIFGFVQATDTMSAGTGHIKGVVVGIKTYTPPKGGSFDFWGGNTGTKVGGPIKKPWLSLQDLEAGDTAVWIGQGNANGEFDIAGVPDGNYTLSWWDEPQDYNLNMINVTISNGETVSMGQLPLNGWWTEFDGYVFNDSNRNGVKDPGEPGVSNFTLTLRHRENNLYDRGQNTATTDANGHYYFESGYPIGEWTVLEAYSDSFYTTGVTYQADNQPTPTTIKGAGVDVSVMPIIGLGGRMDWGVHAYDPTGTNGVDPQNGGIVGTVSYDTTRNELDPRYGATEDWQPGISGVPVELYAPVDCGTTSAPCDADERYEVAPDGSYAKGRLLNTYVSESWQRPTGCTARDVDGHPLVHGVDEDVLVKNQESEGECISSFMQGIQYGTYSTAQGGPDANFGAAVNGNFGFGDGCFTGVLDASKPENPVCSGGFEPLGAGDYLVKVAIPKDPTGKPMYKVTGEEDINIARGDQIIPQVPPPACAGSLRSVDVANDGTDGYGPVVGQGWETNGVPVGVTVPASTAVANPTFVDIGGSPYEGSAKPRCDTLLVPLNNGKSIVPLFHLFTDVPVPSRMRTVIIDDINFSSDPKSIMYGEKVGLAFAPVGIYDFANKLEYTTETDYNGIYDVLMPSTDHISCPTPSGVCSTMYRFVANDPGTPGHLNPNYKPGYATHSAGAEGMPGISTFADLAPTPVGLTVESPGTGIAQVTCPQGAGTPQLFAVTTPYVTGGGSFTIQGTGFGATKGTGSVTLDGTALPTTAWNNDTIEVTVPPGTPVGAHQLMITGDNKQQTVNGLTFHVLGAGYNPTVREVGPGRSYATIQAALDAALANNGDDLVVVFPATPDVSNPRGAYYENLIVASPVKLQGVGPGGFRGSTYVPGTVIDASAYGSDTDLATAWLNKVGALTWDGFQTVQDGEAIYLLASQNATTQAGRARQFTSSFKASVDGFDLRGATQDGFPGNVNDLTGGTTGLPPTITTQGGAIFANAYVRSLQVTNNVVQNNGSSYGTIRIGTPDLAPPETNQHNENVRIANNRVIQNGGTNLAGGIGLFAGSDGYDVAGNDICGNFSLEYGGGLSVYGYSPGGKIHDNRIYLNMSNDEGGGIMIAGQLPQTPGALSPGSGAVDIYANRIQSNLANDDGGGIRFLMAGNYPMNIHDNMIVNNVSTHEGGGIGINDAPNVRVYNNTIMKNLTTATAVTSDGTPAPAGLSTSANSDPLQATLPVGSPLFSNPLLFNNIFWDNRAGTRAGRTVTGLGVTGDATAPNHFDLGVADGTGVLAPTNSVVQQDIVEHPYTTSGTNSSADPKVVQPYDVSVSFVTWRQNPAFVDATLVTLEAPPDQMGDYHLASCSTPPTTSSSSACNLGAATKAVPTYQQPPGTLAAPGLDFDGQVRPALGGIDAGADEFGASFPTPPPPPTADLYFSTVGNTNPPGVNGDADDADVYLRSGSAFSRAIDVSVAPYNVPGSANLDGYSRVDATHFYASFTDNVTLSGIPVADEDVVYFDGTAWSMFFDGSVQLGLTATTALFWDLDAISVVGTTLYFSTDSPLVVPPGIPVLPVPDDADIYRWNGGSSFTRVLDAWDSSSSVTTTLGLQFGANVDGLIMVDSTHFSLSFSSDTTVPVLGLVQDEDVVSYSAGTWSVTFDGTAAGLTGGNLDIDAISSASGAQPPQVVAPRLLFSTLGNVSLPGVSGVADNADIYGWDGTSFTRTLDASGPGSLRIPSSAQVDGFARVDATHFYLSFAAAVTLPGVGAVADEDVVRYDAGTWSMFFDGSAHGLTGIDVGAISVDGTTLYFTTNTAAVPPGAGAASSGDNADVYRWDGASTYTRVVDASEAPYGLPNTGSLTGSNNPNVDGLVWVGPDHFFVSFSNARTNVPGLGAIQDEDVLEYDNGDWSVYFDGTAHGLTASGLDVDAFDVS